MKGVGTDIIEIRRIEKALKRHPVVFCKKIFTLKEREYCFRYQRPAQHLAARFAAKESIGKALGVGLGGPTLSWLDMEILPSSFGSPQVHFSKKVEEHWNNPQILLSMSHAKEYATAVAIYVESASITEW